ncbi:hypothetical protein ABG067_004979 [Albugo candida]
MELSTSKTEEENNFQSRKSSFRFTNDMLGPLTANIQLDSGLSKQALEISYMEHLYFDFKRLTTEVPTKVYEEFKKKLQNIQGIEFFDKKNMAFKCLDDQKMLSGMPSITMDFTLASYTHTYTLTANEYILRVPPERFKIETLEKVCCLTLVPHDINNEWIIGATIAKVMHLKMALEYSRTVVGTILKKNACNSDMVTLLVYLQVARSLLKLFIANEPYVL